MEVESHIAYRLAMQHWTESAAEPAVSRGLSWYLQSRVVEHLFNLSYAVPAYRTERLRLFGGYFPISFPALRLSRWGAGLDTAEADHTVRREITADVVRVALAFASLERYLGWPALQGALAVLASQPEHPLTQERVRDVISAAVGRDLTWFFAFAFDLDRRVEYGVAGVASAPADDGYRTQVTIERLGNALFTGSSRPRVGNYDAGTGIVVAVEFADGESITATWDGRDEQRTFEFAGASPAKVVRLDPDATLLLDPNSQDHWQRTQPASNVPLAKWMARWSLWMQHAVLTYAMLV